MEQSFLDWRTYDYTEIRHILNQIKGSQLIKTNKKIEYYNIPCAFDIETTSFIRKSGKEEEKGAIMYEWTLGLNGYVIVGRKWEEFIYVLNATIEELELWENKRLIIYVHNLSFEFQFMRKWIKWKNVFSLDVRKPVYACTEGGIEFRCSYILSGYSLEKLADQLHEFKVKKMVGDLDYSLMRTYTTPLTEKELRYCINDVIVVMCYIQEKINQDGNITKIPLTKTGYVRNYCRNKCLYDGGHKKNTKKYLDYRMLMESLILTPDEYAQLKRAFQGGFTHASAMYSGKVIQNVGSYDITSSYPYVMISEKFPMSRGERIERLSKSEFEMNLKKYCCMFDIEFFNIRSKGFVETPLSSSKCYKMIKCVENNGRVFSADHLITTITECDYYTIKQFYDWDEIRISNFIRYKKGYLPTDLVAGILKLYADKTTLKNVKGKEIEYMSSKENINACYGMIVTDIVRENIIYDNDNDWKTDEPNLEDAIGKYNKSIRRFLFYPWGVWVTAYARRNLFTGIYEFGEDYVYSDTDSIKGVNCKNHERYINAYNDMVIQKLNKAMEYHNLPKDLYRPKTVKGMEKILGVWDYEGEYELFKTLGAKRYMTKKDGKISITVSGVNKEKCVPYLIETYKTDQNIFDHFEDGLRIPEQYTGKNTHTYIDDEIEGDLTDYLGATAHYKEKSGIHLGPADYSLSISDAYINYLLGVRTYER